jgi:hypothetical protein
MLKVVQEKNESNATGGKRVPAGVGGSLLDELARDGARAMLAAALQAEVAAYVDGKLVERSECRPVHMPAETAA